MVEPSIVALSFRFNKLTRKPLLGHRVTPCGPKGPTAASSPGRSLFSTRARSPSAPHTSWPAAGPNQETRPLPLRGLGMNIAFHNGKPLGMKEVCPVGRERIHRDEETPKGKVGFAMKSSKSAWMGLLVLGFLVCPYAPGYAAEDTQIESSFSAFQKTWIQKLNKEGRYGEKSMRVDRSAEDRSLFVARYDMV